MDPVCSSEIIQSVNAYSTQEPGQESGIDLPDEILLEIFRFLGSAVSDLNHLKHASLVSKQWAKVAKTSSLYPLFRLCLQSEPKQSLEVSRFPIATMSVTPGWVSYPGKECWMIKGMKTGTASSWGPLPGNLRLAIFSQNGQHLLVNSAGALVQFGLQGRQSNWTKTGRTCEIDFEVYRQNQAGTHLALLNSEGKIHVVKCLRKKL